MAADDFLAGLQLVDSADWVADHERTLCYVCTRHFGTFRRKHHCRICGEVVCSNCTLYKDAQVDSAIGRTRVRVCISCVINHPNARSNGTAIGSASPRSVETSEASRLWLQSHLHSPASGPLSEPENEEAHRSMTPKSCKSELKGEQSRADTPIQSEQHTSEPLSNWTHPWPQPPVGNDEEARLCALYALNVLDTKPDTPFDMICDLAKARLSCPMAAVSFLDEHRQWFKASAGLAHKMIPRKIAFCAYTVFRRESLVVLDTLRDARFRKNPLVVGAASVRFYAAAPIVDPNSGYVVGTVFVLDTRPREACDIAILERLAIAAGENLPQTTETTIAITNIDKQPGMSDQIRHTVHKCSTVDCSSSEIQRFNHQNLELPVSPATASSTSSASSISTIQVRQSPSKSKARSLQVVNNQIVETSTEITPLSMGTTTAGEPMEVLLMRLLTQNTETQQQLADQQISLSNKLGQHAELINKLMADFARMEAKIKRKVDGKK